MNYSFSFNVIGGNLTIKHLKLPFTTVLTRTQYFCGDQSASRLTLNCAATCPHFVRKTTAKCRSLLMCLRMQILHTAKQRDIWKPLQHLVFGRAHDHQRPHESDGAGPVCGSLVHHGPARAVRHRRAVSHRQSVLPDVERGRHRRLRDQCCQICLMRESFSERNDEPVQVERSDLVKKVRGYATGKSIQNHFRCLRYYHDHDPDP